MLQIMDASVIYEALVIDHSVLDTDTVKKLKNYRNELNIKQSAWDRLATETNPIILTGKWYILIHYH